VVVVVVMVAVVVLVVMVVIVMMTMAMAMAMATTDKHVRNKPLCFKCGTGVRPAHWIRCDSYDSVMFCFVSFKAEHLVLRCSRLLPSHAQGLAGPGWLALAACPERSVAR
jgi:NADH:ubiquinone oxidoreductase subunit 3 (subunit A)